VGNELGKSWRRRGGGGGAPPVGPCPFACRVDFGFGTLPGGMSCGHVNDPDLNLGLANKKGSEKLLRPG
jgi:hypothetical protein